MTREDLKRDVIKLVQERKQVSIREIARLYNETRYISKRLVREIIKELLAEGIFVKVNDTDCFGYKMDDIAISENYE